MSAGAAGPHSAIRLGVAALLIVFMGLAAGAMLRTSTTFDEIIFPAAGARGYATGDFGMIRDHTPIMQYVYGLPLRVMSLRYPPEEGRQWDHLARYVYARVLLWQSGNEAGRIVAAARMVAVLLGAALVLATFLLARAALGEGAALLAAALVAFLPDVLAHSGVTYNDVPAALALLVAAYAADRALRTLTPGAALLAGLAAGIAIGVKSSAIAILPIALALAILEGMGRWRDAVWRRSFARAIVVFGLALYLTLALAYLGDFRLAGLREVLGFNFQLNDGGHPAMILGTANTAGFWYFFPLTFFLKTPAAFHALGLVALVGAWLGLRGTHAAALAKHPLRAPVVAAGILAAGLVASRINLGFRHALPLLPFLCILVAAGAARIWHSGRGAARAVIALLVAADIASAVSAYPWFLSYLSEYASGKPSYEVLVDSNTDWGQGLVALRDYLRERGIRRVSLAYFGSALPEGYGIDYVPLPSFFRLPQRTPPPEAAPPRYVAISATLMGAPYLEGDPYAAYREREPAAVIARSIFLYEAAH